jgi:hypothetical protein
MARIDIQGLRIVDATIEKLWGQGIGDDQVYAVLNHEWITTRNRRQRATSHLLIGTDNQGRCLTIPIVATEDPVIWRPITAWYCKPSEATILRQRKRQ